MLHRIQRLAWRAQRSKSLSLAALLQLLAINAFLLFCAPALFADDCTRDWRRAEDCLRTPGFAQSIGTTAGVLATVLVNGVAVVRLVLTPPQPAPTGGQDGGQPQQPPKEYFLNIQTQGYRTQMKTDGTDSLWVYASVSCNDPTVDCAALTQAVGFYVGGDNSSWITPSAPAPSGGSMAIELKAAPPTPDARLTPPGSISVTASAVLEGKQVSGDVEISLSSEVEFVAWAGGKKEVAAVYNKTDKRWFFPNIVCYFQTPGFEKPVMPPFKYGFPAPPFETDPPNLLSAKEFYTSDDGLSYEMKMELDDVDALTRAFGPKLDQNGGRVKVKITAMDEQQRPYVANVTYVVEPELVPLYWMFDEDSRVSAETRTYRDAELAPFEVCTDGKDEMKVALIFVRSDLIEEGADPTDYIQEADETVKVTKIEISGDGSSQFEAVPDEREGTPYEFKVKSKSLVLSSATSDGYKPLIRVEARSGEKGPGFDFTINMRHRAIFMKLIVVPGSQPGTSLAVVYTGTVSLKGEPQPLSGTPVRVETVCQGDAYLGVEGNSDSPTDKSGVASFTLRYRGLTWKNKAQVQFKVRAGITEPNDPPFDATYQTINIEQNGARFLEAFAQAAPSLKLNNPVFRERSLGFLWPDFLSGPVNNINDMISGLTGAQHFAPYTCGQLRDRIWGWTFERRHSYDLDTTTSMNGLDFFKYHIAPIHVWFGFNMAGTEDPYFIDPWWEQSFNPDCGIQTYTDEVKKASGMLAAGALVIAPYAYALAVSLGYTWSLAFVQGMVVKWLAILMGGGEAGYGAWTGSFPIGKDSGEGYRFPDTGAYSDAPAHWGPDFFNSAGFGRSYKSAGLDTKKNSTGHVSPLESW
jgi:hypothetical protein